MASVKAKALDQKHEKIIRTLLKLPENRKCLTCCTRTTPQYVCTTFSTFICTTCSGIHRGFGYRVKSISYASFTPEEVNSLKAGGNEVARKRWLHKWTKEQTPIPEEGNEKGIHKFIDKVFDRKLFLIREEEELHQSAAKSAANLAQPPLASTSFSLPKPTPVAAVVSQSNWATFDSPAAKTSTGGAATPSSSWAAFDNFTTSESGGQTAANNKVDNRSNRDAPLAAEQITGVPAAAPSIAAVSDPFASTSAVPMTSEDIHRNRTEGQLGGVPAPQASANTAWVAFDTPTSSTSTLVGKSPPPAMPEEKKEEEPSPTATATAAAEQTRKELPLDLFTMDNNNEPSSGPGTGTHMGMMPQGPGASAAYQNGGGGGPLPQAQAPTNMMQMQMPQQQQQQQQSWNYGNPQNPQQYGIPQGMAAQAGFYQPQAMPQAQATWQPQANHASSAPLAQQPQGYTYTQQPPFASPPQGSRWMQAGNNAMNTNVQMPPTTQIGGFSNQQQSLPVMNQQYGVQQQQQPTPSPSNGNFSSLPVSPNMTYMQQPHVQPVVAQPNQAGKAQPQGTTIPVGQSPNAPSSMGLNNNGNFSSGNPFA